MTLQIRDLSSVGVQGTIYVFETGDVLPMHSHDSHTHISVVARGVFEEYGRAGPRRVRRAGAVVDFPLGTTHEWLCVEGPGTLVNIAKQLPTSHNGTQPSDQNK